MARDPYKYFRIEARELVEKLGQGLLELERAPSEAAVAGLLRLAHTLKGAARVVKQSAVADVAHALEDALAPHRSGHAAPSEVEMQAMFRLVDAMGERLRALDAPEPAQPAEATGPAPEPQPFESVRVELGELDRVLEPLAQVGIELLGAKQVAGELERARQLAASLRAGEELTVALEKTARALALRLEQADRELGLARARADQLRLVPASAIFAELERAVRDVATSLGRKVAFETSGGEHRVDPHVLAGLREAFLHVVRNAAAHGIEPESARLAAGKPAEGRVQLAFERRGAMLVCSCRDDGRGVDVEAVRRAAVRSGALTAEQTQALSAGEALRLVFRAGLSTTAVSEHTGRGVGLDVVREVAARLRGEVDLRSEPGRGTTVELRAPTSLTSIRALHVQAGGLAAAIPLEAVRKTVRVQPGELVRAPGGDAFMDDGTAVPFAELARVLERPGATSARAGSVVLVDGGAGRAALGVERVLGISELVVRPIPRAAGESKLVAGAALDPEGTPELLLQPAALVEAARKLAPGGEPHAAARLPVLIVDDSLTTRMLEQSILESAGYAADLATSGVEALGLARQKRYGVFLVDVEMPGMDGFEFVARTRADPALRETPAILITSRNAPEDRQRGLEAGARAYLDKGAFNQQQLLRLIRELMG